MIPLDSYALLLFVKRDNKLSLFPLQTLNAQNAKEQAKSSKKKMKEKELSMPPELKSSKPEKVRCWDCGGGGDKAIAFPASSTANTYYTCTTCNGYGSIENVNPRRQAIEATKTKQK